jgi:large subunit ribosomal protein L22
MADETYTYKLRYTKIAPRKLRYVVDLVRGKSVNSALAALQFCSKRGAPMCRKLLNSAIAGTSEKANKAHVDIDVNNLYIHEIRVDSGPTRANWTQRVRPGFRRPFIIKKRWSHLILVLKEKKGEAAPPTRETKKKD